MSLGRLSLLLWISIFQDIYVYIPKYFYLLHFPNDLLIPRFIHYFLRWIFYAYFSTREGVSLSPKISFPALRTNQITANLNLCSVIGYRLYIADKVKGPLL